MHAGVQMKYFYLLALFILSSCNIFDKDEVIPAEAEVRLYNEWLYSFELKDLKVNSEVIGRPPGIEQLLFSLKLPVAGGDAFKTHCVYYQVPYKNLVGKLVVTEQKANPICPAIATDNLWLELSHLSDLSVSFEQFKLKFNFKYKLQKYSWKFLLPNIEQGVIHEKYQPMSEKRLFSGMQFLRISEDTFDQTNNKYLGKLSDRMSRGTAIRCLQIDKNCQHVGEDRCDDCRYGWYQVVDYDCPQGGSRFCGQNHCGEKNEPACVRGAKVIDIDEAGICQSDLSPVVNAEHILVCQ